MHKIMAHHTIVSVFNLTDMAKETLERKKEINFKTTELAEFTQN